MAESECRSSLIQRVVVPVKDAPLDSVVVYRDRAEVKRRVSVKLEAGENEVKVSHLAESVDKNSIRVEGLGKKANAAIITDVVYLMENKRLKEQENEGEEEIKTEHESLKALIKEKEAELKHLEFRDAVLVKEKQLLRKFVSHISQTHTQKDSRKEAERNVFSQLLEGSAVVALVEFMERYEEKLAALDRRILEVGTHQQKLKEEVKVLQANAERVNPQTRARETEIIQSVTISLEASENCKVILLVSYVVSNASWTSSYDVRVFTKDKTMKVQYYGLIKQSTGEDWDDVSVALSTAQPSIGGSAPYLPARIIKFKRIILYKNVSQGNRARYTVDRMIRSSNGTDEDEEEGLYEEQFLSLKPSASRQLNRRGSTGSLPRSLAVETTKVEAGLFNATFNIPRITTIPADNTEHKVTVALVDLQPQFHYVSRPKLSQYAFLQANAKNTSSYTMLAGPSNVFLDNNFVAKSKLCDVSPSEQFNISLGVDQAVRITCQPVAVVRGTARGLSKHKLHTYTHTIKVKNTRDEKVDIEVSEQVPLSTDERIKVNVAEPDLRRQGVAAQLPFGHAVLNASNNIEWHAAVEPDQELELRLVYSVEHPPQDSVAGLPKL